MSTCVTALKLLDVPHSQELYDIENKPNKTEDDKNQIQVLYKQVRGEEKGILPAAAPLTSFQCPPFRMHVFAPPTLFSVQEGNESGILDCISLLNQHSFAHRNWPFVLCTASDGLITAGSHCCCVKLFIFRKGLDCKVKQGYKFSAQRAVSGK
eukprot:scaffold32060_cov19-Tisochrysis_lutea.AAC.1